MNKIQIEAKTDGQQEYIDLIKNNKIVFCEGPAGSGKTFIPSVMALNLFFQKKYERIIISRPLVQSDSETGFLPGNLDEKMEPYMRPIVEVFGQMVNKGDLERLFKERWIEIAPLGYLRGRTFNNCFIIFDEMQNADYGQLLLAITRFGKGSKMILTGDSSQSDLRTDDKAFLKIMDNLDDIDDIGISRLTTMDIVREPIVKKILERIQKGV